MNEKKEKKGSRKGSRPYPRLKRDRKRVNPLGLDRSIETLSTREGCCGGRLPGSKLIQYPRTYNTPTIILHNPLPSLKTGSPSPGEFSEVIIDFKISWSQT